MSADKSTAQDLIREFAQALRGELAHRATSGQPPKRGGRATSNAAGGNRGGATNRRARRTQNAVKVPVPPPRIKGRPHGANNVCVQLHIDTPEVGQYVVATSQQLDQHGHVLDGLVAAVARYNYGIVQSFREWRQEYTGPDRKIPATIRELLLGPEGKTEANCYRAVSLLISFELVRQLRSAVMSWIRLDVPKTNGGASVDTIAHARELGLRLQSWLEVEHLLPFNQIEASAVQFAKTVNDREKPLVVDRLSEYCVDLNNVIVGTRPSNRIIKAPDHGTLPPSLASSSVDNKMDTDDGPRKEMKEFRLKRRQAFNLRMHGLQTCLEDLVGGRLASIPLS